MDIWLFGSPTSSEALRALKQAGVSRVVARGEALAAAQAEGLTSYTVLHAFPTTDDQEDLAQDVWGRPIEWFGSACPNSAGSRSKFFNSLAAIKSQVAGVFLDGVPSGPHLRPAPSFPASALAVNGICRLRDTTQG